MECAREGEVLRFLHGDLGAGQTSAVMDHLRTCRPCRSRLDTAGAVAPTSARDPGVPPFRRYTHEEVDAARNAPPRWRQRGLIALVMVVLLTWVATTEQRKRGRTSADPTRADEACANALAEGRPYPIQPSGPGPRPRQFRLVLPPGHHTFTLRVSLDGSNVFERTFDDSDADAEIFETTGGTEGRSFPAIAAILPFPDDGQLTLIPGAAYAWRVLLPDGVVGGPLLFEVDAP